MVHAILCVYWIRVFFVGFAFFRECNIHKYSFNELDILFYDIAVSSKFFFPFHSVVVHYSLQFYWSSIISREEVLPNLEILFVELGQVKFWLLWLPVIKRTLNFEEL